MGAGERKWFYNIAKTKKIPNIILAQLGKSLKFAPAYNTQARSLML